MGINGGWKVLQEAKGLQQLSDICSEMLEKNNRPVTIGVDASIQIRRAESVGTQRAKHAHFGASPELRVIFFQLGVLARFGANVVFVFDGPGRPKIKRGSRVWPTHWLTDQVKELVRTFGFQCHLAPGEAEAELAEMNARGMIDVVFTNDVDCLLFGAEDEDDDFSVISISSEEHVDDEGAEYDGSVISISSEEPVYEGAEGSVISISSDEYTSEQASAITISSSDEHVDEGGYGDDDGSLISVSSEEIVECMVWPADDDSD